MTNMILSTWEALNKACWMRKGDSDPGIICFIGKGKISNSYKEPFLSPFYYGRRIHLSTNDPFISNSLEVTTGVPKVICCLTWNLEKSHHAPFQLFLKFLDYRTDCDLILNDDYPLLHYTNCLQSSVWSTHCPRDTGGF